MSPALVLIALQVESTIASATEKIGRLVAEKDGLAADNARLEGLLASLAATIGCDPGALAALMNDLVEGAHSALLKT